MSESAACATESIFLIATSLLNCLLVSVSMKCKDIANEKAVLSSFQWRQICVFCYTSLLLSGLAAWYSTNSHSYVNLSCFFSFLVFLFSPKKYFNTEKWIAACLCPSSVLATMKRRLDAGSESLHEAKRAHEDSSSDEESQLSRQGRCFHVKNNLRLQPKENMCTQHFLNLK